MSSSFKQALKALKNPFTTQNTPSASIQQDEPIRLEVSRRMRRLRRREALRSLVRETVVRPQDLIQPYFVVEGKGQRQPVSSMPGVARLSVDELCGEAEGFYQRGGRAVLLFGVTESKGPTAPAAWDENGVIPQAVTALRRAVRDLVVMTDVCLCAYTDHGHCGLLNEHGEVDNDRTLQVLAQMALAHARAGADFVCPSDMMDLRVGFIRQSLDREGYHDVGIMSYAAKYASAFYGPFREAADSAPSFGDRKSYQMDPANAREAVVEVALDVSEGADIVMVKPAMPYLDVIQRVRQRVDLPIAAYQVSGEYAMIKAAAQKGWLDEKRARDEALLAIKRAGADLIITYFADAVLKEATN